MVRAGNKKVIRKPFGTDLVKGVPGVVNTIHRARGSWGGWVEGLWDWHLEVIPSLCKDPDGRKRGGWLGNLLDEG